MIESALNRILQPGGITPVYQPVFRVDGDSLTVDAVECLARGPKGSNFESASVLFEYVRLKREESLVDRACIVAALRGASQFPANIRLALNVHASTLGRDHGFIDFLTNTANATGITLERLTIDVVEHAPPWDGMSFLAAIEQLRELGLRIALDDVGLGQSNFKMLLDVEPDYLKVDRYFVDGCANDARRRAVIVALRDLGSQFEAEIVAEGVTGDADSRALQELGVTLMQGFHFGEPVTAEAFSGATTHLPLPSRLA
ncbi:MAG TPA: EAL domain-containing protein [Thermoanaerobaculia bacterium]|nr:EAL domain-containing protein [Thermoanaerobaculia bacterium]